MDFLSPLKKTYRFFRPRKEIKTPSQIDIFNEGYKTFKKTNVTTQESYMALVNLFCETNGKFNEDFHQQIKNDNPPAKVPNELSGFAGKLSKSDFKNINHQLKEEGYVKFDGRLSKDLCRKLYDYALRTPAKTPGREDKIIYDPNNPISEIYRLDIVDQINNTDIQSLIMDPVLINVARNYLESEPVFDFPAMWWSTSFSKEASSEAAQLYHFDLDRIKWLKIFFYINDVTEDNGPHCYIRKTHKVGAKPEAVLKKGYARIEDSELRQYHPADDFIVLTAEAGTVFAGDTKCWHKGSPLRTGHRLVLEFEYTTSMFGAKYPTMVVTNTTDEFKQFCAQNRINASNIHIQ